MILVMKSIKPARLKDKEMRLELLNGMRRCATGIRHDFEETTKTWEHKPKFESEVSLTGPGPVVLVGTNDQTYQYVDEGTRPHPIFAGYYTGKSRARVLAFAGTFIAKTVPGVLGSGAGSRGPTDTFTPYVQHRGTKARGFSKMIQKVWEKRFKQDMQDAMKEAAKASGHGM
jgi:hypothetical protein